jgi:hypothetical protein
MLLLGSEFGLVGLGSRADTILMVSGHGSCADVDEEVARLADRVACPALAPSLLHLGGRELPRPLSQPLSGGVHAPRVGGALVHLDDRPFARCLTTAV